MFRHCLLLSFILSVFFFSFSSVTALPEPRTTTGIVQQQSSFQNKRQEVGFVVPPLPAPPYGKSLPSTSYSSSSRSWTWTQFLADAKSSIKASFKYIMKRPPHSHPSTLRLGNPEEEQRDVVRFDKDIVIRINVTSLSDRVVINELAESMILDVWSMTPKHVDIRIPRTSVKGFLSMLPKHLTQHEPIITNLLAAVDYTYPTERTYLPPIEQLLALTKPPGARARGNDIHYLSELFFTNYQNYKTVNQWMHLLEALRPELVKVVNIGKSHEGRDILGVTIKGRNAKKSDQESMKTKNMAILMHGAQHAREWISVSTVCYIAYQLVTNYYVDDEIRNLVDQFEWHLFPISNVDGYEYSWTTDRLWRKNRQSTPVPFCTGIDPDHSWAYMWDTPGSEQFSSNPCSESYRGEKPFEAIESKLLAKYISKTLPSQNVNPIGYVDFHSYSQLILYPFAYDCDVLPRDAEDLAEAAWGAAKAARQVHGRYFDVDSACEGDSWDPVKKTTHVKIINGGAAVDWAYAKGKVRYAYSVKLRDTGNHGFLLPKSEIVPSGEEMFAMAKQLAGFILERMSFRSE